MDYAKQQGSARIGLACEMNSVLLKNVDVAICVPVGPEILYGSTRLKAGSAQKMILNMLSTAVMVKLGKVYKNHMVDLQVSNIKLLQRAEVMVAELGEVPQETAAKLLKETGNNVKTAIVMAKRKINVLEAENNLKAVDGILSKIL